MHRLTTTGLFFGLLWPLIIFAKAGDLDLGFGNRGRVVTDFHDRTDVAGNLIIDNDGKIVLAGGATKHSITDHFALVRYNQNGSLDQSFGQGGRVVSRAFSENRFVDGGIMGLDHFSDGRIIACGRGWINGVDGFALVSYQKNGDLDTTFGDEGALILPDIDEEIYPLALTIDAQDRIVMVASSLNTSGTAASFAVFRFDAQGGLDESFGELGKAITPIVSGINVPRAVQVDTDGSIVVGGFNGDDKFVVVKYLADGKLDTNFGINGISTIHFNSGGIDTLHALVIQPDGKIVVGGDVQIGNIGGIRTIDFGLARLTKDGQLDLSFNKTGKQITYFVQPAASSLWALTLQKDGKIIAVGDAALVKSLGMARYNIDGTLDETFGDHGKQMAACPGTCHWEAVALQADNKIVAGGYVWNDKHYDMAVTRFMNDVAID